MFLVVIAAAGLFLSDLDGSWSGYLEYCDYQSNGLEQISVAVENELHGRLLISKFNFTDPGVQVYRASVTSYDAESGKAFEAYVRDGSAEHYESDYALEETVDGWTMTQTRQGLDGDDVAMIRDVTSYDGEKLITERTVDVLGDGQEDFLFRNRLVVTRQQ
ncbi:MAG: hypothetical protein AAFX52_12120 [Pseudomonadota bacterium]